MDAISEQALDALAAAGRRAAEEGDLDEALRLLAAAAAEAAGADAAVIRVPDDAGRLAARAVFAGSQALAAELEGSTFSLTELPPGEVTGDLLPEAVRHAAQRTHASDVVLLPVRSAEKPLGSLELMRASGRFEALELALARLAVSHLGLVLRAFLETNGAERGVPSAAGALALAGDALTAGLDQRRAAGEIVRIAAGAAGAQAALLWRVDQGGPPELVASAGSIDIALDEAGRAADRTLAEQHPVRVEADGAGAGRSLATLRLGQPAVGALQLAFHPGAAPAPAELDRLATFAVRAAQALRAGEQTWEMALELERTQALLGVVVQAIAQLSLAHTLETTAARVSELLRADRVAVYLRYGSRLRAASGKDLAESELALAEGLLEAALGPMRAQGMLRVKDADTDVRLAHVRDAVRETGVEAALAVPLLVREELIGLLAVYLPRGRELTANESALLAALAGQLAVAVENARLHERAKRLGSELEQALTAERESARRLWALYEISRTFAQSLSLEETLQAVARTAVELIDADAAVIRVPDEPGDQLVPRATHVADPRLAEPLHPLLKREQSIERLPGRRLFRMGKPLVLDPDSARRLGASYELLVPFLEQGSTAIVVPITTPAELLATLTIVSLDPERRIGVEETETALFVAGQAALAIDNARLYQQQKDFADTMQRSLLPPLPEVRGLEVGAVYESSAQAPVEVGGDVYDFMPLQDGRLAVVLGDVSGHGIAATGDMALAKYVFRSLARRHPEPGDLLAQANEVVLDELAMGSFITMVCLAVDAERGEVRAASAGHPPAKLLDPDGAVSTLAPQGLALGVEPGQRYEEVRRAFHPGGTVVLYTDGLVEARSGGEAYGEQRLEAALAAARELPAQALAERLVADCRAFAGEPADDYAVVVIRRTG